MRLRNRTTDDNLARLMRIAIEGPELTSVDFDNILYICDWLYYYEKRPFGIKVQFPIIAKEV